MRENQGRGKLNWLNRIKDQKRLAKEQGEEISDEEARKREVAKLHRPTLKVPIWNRDLYDRWSFNPSLFRGSEIALNQQRISLPFCVALEPFAVHAKRDYDKITTEVGRMIAEGLAQPEEIRLMCSAFFVLRRNGEDFLVRFGERRYPYRIGKERLRVSYENDTVTLSGNLLKVKSVGTFEYYFHLYTMLVGSRRDRD
jgi:hypothetical protein